MTATRSRLETETSRKRGHTATWAALLTLTLAGCSGVVEPGAGAGDGTPSGADAGATDSDARSEDDPLPMPSGAVTSDFSLRELEIYRDRAQGVDRYPFAEAGDSGANSPGDWSRIVRQKDAFVASRAGLDAAALEPRVTNLQHGQMLETADRYNFWDGPIPGRTTHGNDSLNINWNGQGQVPTWARATKKQSGAECTASDYNYVCQDAFRYGDDMLAASFYSLVEEDASVRDDVAAALVRQTDPAKAPGVDFSNRERWAFGVPGVSGHVASTNPYFFTSLWVVKVAKAYEYSRVKVVDGEVVDSGAYTAEEKEQIETWLRNAGEYFRIAVESLYVGTYEDSIGFFATAEDRVAGNANHGHAGTGMQMLQSWFSGYKLWDTGYRPTLPQLQYQNRVQDTAMSFCVIGFTVEDALMQRDCAMFFKEVIKYAMDKDGYLVDFYRGGGYQMHGETGLHYVTGQLAHLVEIADLFARHGDDSLYLYETEEGACTRPDGYPESRDPSSSFTCTNPFSSGGDVVPVTSSTVGGPKGLLKGLLATAEFYKRSGHAGLTKDGYLINGNTSNGSDEGRYLQHNAMWAQANVFYRNQALADAIYSNRDAGYHGWAPRDKVKENGYIVDTTRGTFGASVGHLFLYGKTETSEYENWPYPASEERPFYE